MHERYQRQILLKEIGLGGQQKLASAKVLVVGAGGLGCPALLYLAGAGVGVLGIADDDTVQLSNLHRQLLYSTNDIGRNKAEAAAERLVQINPEIAIQVYNEMISVNNALEIFGAYDIIIDGTDNFASRYMINDACVLLGKPLVYGAVSKFEGQVSVFNYQVAGEEISANYRDLFAEPPKKSEVKSCDEAGVLGVLPGIIGTMQATETIKIIIGLGLPLANRLLNYNALSNRFYEIKLKKNTTAKSSLPGSVSAFRQMNYPAMCGHAFSDLELSIDAFEKMMGNNNVEIIDVRAPHELPLVEEFQHRNIPAAEILDDVASFKSETIILFCQSGKRSLDAARKLNDVLGDTAKVYSLSGGIQMWKQNKMKI